MSETPPPAEERTQTDDDVVVIAVVRTGGIAGIRRRWRVAAAPEDAGDWIALIDRCPWDAPPSDTEGADRFVWSIRARTPSERREQELPDAALDGPWRALVDAVRAASAE
jgi:hypothetical protein